MRPRDRYALLLCLAVACSLPAPARAEPAARNLWFNGHPATTTDRRVIERLEAAWGARVPDGAYWYDRVSGAAGRWGGPTSVFLPAGLPLGGALPASASGGGNGWTTGVFINGREIHPLDASALSRMLGGVQPGRWWVDARGNAGHEGGPLLFNLLLIAKARGGGGGGGDRSRYTSDGHGNATFISPGCSSVSGHLGGGSAGSAYSYYVGCD